METHEITTVGNNREAAVIFSPEEIWDDLTDHSFNHWNVLTACVTAATAGLLLYSGCGPLLFNSSPASDPLLGTKRLLFAWAWVSCTSAGVLFSFLPFLPTSALFGSLFYHLPLWTVYYLFARWVVSLYFMNRRYAQGLTEVEELVHLLAPGILFLVLALMIILDYIVLDAESTDGFVVVQIMLSTTVFLLVAAALSRAFRSDEMGFTPSALPVLRRLRATLPLLGLASALMLTLKATCYLGEGACHALRVPFSAAAATEAERHQGKEMNSASFVYAAGVVMLPSALIAWSFTAPVPFLGLFSPRGRKDGLECGVADPGCLFSLGVALFACSTLLLRTSKLSEEETQQADNSLALPSPTNLTGSGNTAPPGRVRPVSLLQMLAQVARQNRGGRHQTDAEPLRTESDRGSQSTPPRRIPWNVFRAGTPLGVSGGPEMRTTGGLVPSEEEGTPFGSVTFASAPSRAMPSRFGSLFPPAPTRVGLSLASEIVAVASDSAGTGANDNRSCIRFASSGSPVAPPSQGDQRLSERPRESAGISTDRPCISVAAESAVAVGRSNTTSPPLEKELEREHSESLMHQDAEWTAGWATRQFQPPIAAPWSLEDLSLRHNNENEEKADQAAE
eukprot:Hpha_TRINITY_DN13594_c0_g1::TRINITY_DN13594_c0_g1_i1::g.111278::m.111278